MGTDGKFPPIVKSCLHIITTFLISFDYHRRNLKNHVLFCTAAYFEQSCALSCRDLLSYHFYSNFHFGLFYPYSFLYFYFYFDSDFDLRFFFYLCPFLWIWNDWPIYFEISLHYLFPHFLLLNMLKYISMLSKSENWQNNTCHMKQ